MALDTATIAGGCFWCTEAVFVELNGVASVESGYVGGRLVDPDYKSVCSGTTGHAEAVRISYDPAVLSYGDLLDIFFHTHDPTTLNRQGGDAGTQYRSAIFPQNAEQARLARAYVAQLTAAKTWPGKIVTTLEPGKPFYPAEAYHQNFLRLNPDYPYIVINDLPKVAGLKTRFPQLWSDKPAG